MGNLKKLEPLTGWIEYELETTLLDPPILKVRLRPSDAFSAGECLEEFDTRTRALLEGAIRAVAAWDLTQDGEPIPLEAATKGEVLRPLMSEKVKGRDAVLGLAINADSRNRELFLKN
jgi:hypothetical protein